MLTVDPIQMKLAGIAYDDVANLSDAEVKQWVRDLKSIPRMGRPQMPSTAADLPMPEKILLWQRYIERFEYNFTGYTFVNVNKNRYVTTCVCGIL